MMKIEGGRK